MHVTPRAFALAVGLCLMSTSVWAGTVTNSYTIPEPDEVTQGSYRSWYVPIAAPSGAVITNVEARFEYTAYGVVQNYVSVRLNRGSDPGSYGGSLIVPEGALPAGQPGSYGWVSRSNWNGQLATANYWFRFMLDGASPYTCTIHGIEVRVTYDIPAPSAPTLYQPSNLGIVNRYQSSSIYFDWSSVSGATSYHINVFPEGQSWNPVIDRIVSASSWTESIGSFGNGIYVYQVRAGASGVYGDWSTARRFIADTPPDPPPLYSPGNGAAIASDTYTVFDWGNSPDSPISRYYFRMVRGTDLNATPVLQTEVTSTSWGQTLSDALFDPGTYTWGVRAIKETPSGFNSSTYESTIGWGGYNTRTIEVVGGVPDPPNLIFPSNYSIYNRNNTSNITFGWGGNNDALEYQLNVFPEGQSGSPVFNGTVTNTAYTLGVSSSWAPAVYVWQVRVRTSGGWSNWSTARQFVVDIPPPPPTLTGPADGSTFFMNDAAGFTWSDPPAVNVARYYWRLVAGTDLNADPIGQMEPASSGLSAVFGDNYYSPGTYTWGVRAIKTTPPGYNATTYESTIGWGVYATAGFQIQAAGFATLTPADGGTVPSADIDFSWENVGAVRYELTVDNDPNFGSPEINPTDPNFGSITDTFKNIEGNWLLEGTWHWFVKAVFADGSERVSETASFSYLPPKLAQPAWGPLYRLYNSGARDHFYCSSEAHQAGAMGEGYAAEGVEGHISYTPFSSPNMVPLYRFWHFDFEGGHLYATGHANRDALLQDPTYRYEGITGYVFDAPLEGLVPLYHLQKDFTDGSGRRDNFYTIRVHEVQNAISAYDFVYLGIIGYVSPTGDLGPMAWSPWTMLAGLGASPDNGNLKHAETPAFDIPGIGLPLRFAHQYNSRAIYYPSAVQSLGPGWTHDYSSCITRVGDRLYVSWASGAMHVYDVTGPTTAECLVDGVYDEITLETADRIRIKKKSQVSYLFERPTADHPYMLKEIRDRNANTVTCTYEPTGLRRLIEVTGPSGRNLDIVYHTAAGLQTSIHTVTDPAGREVRFEYDGATGDLIQYVNAENFATDYSYEPLRPHEHQLKTVQLPDGSRIDNEYVDRKLTRQAWTDQAGAVNLSYGVDQTTLSFQDVTRQVSVSFLPGADALQPRRPSVVTRGGDSVTYQYDNAAHPTLPSSVTDELGNSHFFFYDTRGNLTEESHPLGRHFQYQYDGFNNVTRVTDRLSAHTVYGYDTSGNLVSITQPEGGVVTLVRDGRGQVTRVTDYAGNTDFTYDARGNLVQVTDGMGNSFQFTVDLVGRVTRATDALGNTTQYAVDDRGLITQVTDPLGGTLSLSYDEVGRRTAASGLGSTSTHWTWNDHALQTFQSPSYSTTFTYDGDGRVQRRSRPLGDVDYGYDDAGRLTSISAPRAATFVRDAAGRITTVNDPLSPLQFSYDALDRVTSATDPWGYTVDYVYDDLNRKTRITYAPGKDVESTYDANGRLVSVQDWNGRTTSWTYRPDGRVERVDRPNGTWTTYDYDAAGRRTQIVHAGGSGTIASYEFTLDARGNPVEIATVEPLGTQEVVTANVSYTTNAAGQLVSDGTNTYTYDVQGNVASMSGARNLTLGFDEENRLLSLSGEATANYLYDAFGNRRQVDRGGPTVRYVLDVRGTSRVLAEVNGGGTPIAYYVYGPGLVSRILPDGTTHYYHGDQIGNVVAMTDQDGNVTHAYSYDPYGRILEEDQADPNPFTFAGIYGVMREPSGLYYMRARYYDSEVGRFLSEDPIWTPNLYAYAYGNPLSFADPKGTEPEDRGVLEDTWYFFGHIVTLGHAYEDKVDENVKKGASHGKRYGKALAKDIGGNFVKYTLKGKDAVVAVYEHVQGDSGKTTEMVVKEITHEVGKDALSLDSIPGYNVLWELGRDYKNWFVKTRIEAPLRN